MYKKCMYEKGQQHQNYERDLWFLNITLFLSEIDLPMKFGVDIAYNFLCFALDKI